jgi:DNA-binding NtrC family response regulator
MSSPPPPQLSQEEIAAARVLVVDDESLITDILSNFLSLDLGIAVEAFNDPEAALKRVVDRDLDLLISDFVMPAMDGIRLLTEARKVRPEVPRVLLTGYADKDSAIAAINDAQLFNYVEKPWDNVQLKQVIVGALNHRHLVRIVRTTLSELSATRDDLRHLQGVLARVFC